MSGRVRLLLIVGFVVAAFAGISPAAQAAVREVHPRSGPISHVFHADESSYNWSGYVVTGTSFSDIKGTWTVPKVDCSVRTDAFSSFWVGLGGYAPGANALEQEGTDADCFHGQSFYTAWYEIIPAPPVTIPLNVNPGDVISTDVSVNGQTVLFTLNDQTSGHSYSQQFQIPGAVDTSSAEWITEAPSTCDGGDISSCHPLPLANYGQVTFSGATATAAGQQGTISAPSWTATSIELDGMDGTSSLPSPLASDGSAFATLWNDVGSANVPAAPAPAAPVSTTPAPPTTTPTVPVAQPKPTKPAPVVKPSAKTKPKAKAKAKAKAKKRPVARHKSSHHAGG